MQVETQSLINLHYMYHYHAAGVLARAGRCIFKLSYETDTYYVVVGGGSEQAAERDDRRQTGEVHEEEGGDALDVKPVLVVAQVPLGLQLHVVNQTSKQPAHAPHGNRR